MGGSAGLGLALGVAALRQPIFVRREPLFARQCQPNRVCAARTSMPRNAEVRMQNEEVRNSELRRKLQRSCILNS